jgi:hypothetical protein
MNQYLIFIKVLPDPGNGGNKPTRKRRTSTGSTPSMAG